MIAINRIMRTSLNRERRSEDRLADKEEEDNEEEEKAVVMEAVMVMEAVGQMDEGNCLKEVFCPFNGNGEQSSGKCKELDGRVEE